MTTFDTSVPLGGILLGYGIALLFGFAIGIIVYVFQSIGLYKMAKKFRVFLLCNRIGDPPETFF